MATLTKSTDAPEAIEIELTRDEVQHLLMGIQVTIRADGDGGTVTIRLAD